jgi:hypothetical protein
VSVGGFFVQLAYYSELPDKPMPNWKALSREESDSASLASANYEMASQRLMFFPIFIYQQYILAS